MVAARRSTRSVLAADELPPGFVRWRVRLEPGTERATSAADWRGALVLVERGTVDVECIAGGSARFRRGDFLALGWLPLRALRNPGHEPLELLAVRRVGSGR
jgi:hypothetical protein